MMFDAKMRRSNRRSDERGGLSYDVPVYFDGTGGNGRVGGGPGHGGRFCDAMLDSS
jgi:hypothetical protein